MSDGLMLLSIGDDGIARTYDDTWDITIHCESREEQEEAIKALEGAPRWIPCSERMPFEDGEYLCDFYGHVHIAQMINKHFRLYGNIIDHLIIAWMPLPEPYKGGRQ